MELCTSVSGVMCGAFLRVLFWAAILIHQITVAGLLECRQEVQLVPQPSLRFWYIHMCTLHVCMISVSGPHNTCLV